MFEVSENTVHKPVNLSTIVEVRTLVRALDNYHLITSMLLYNSHFITRHQQLVTRICTCTLYHTHSPLYLPLDFFSSASFSSSTSASLLSLSHSLPPSSLSLTPPPLTLPPSTHSPTLPISPTLPTPNSLPYPPPYPSLPLPSGNDPRCDQHKDDQEH